MRDTRRKAESKKQKAKSRKQKYNCVCGSHANPHCRFLLSALIHCFVAVNVPPALNPLIVSVPHMKFVMFTWPNVPFI